VIEAFVAPFNITAQNIDRISKGDIPESITKEYKGDFNEIKNNLNQLIQSLEEIIGEIRSGTGVLLDSVQDLTVSAQEISSTSNQQAAAVKEIVSTMEDSDQLSKSITGKISEVTQMTTTTKSVVDDGFSVIQESLAKMDDIKGANAETITEMRSLGEKIGSIWEIVNMINDIADQTKIIAFNAELEASSAGDAGKNFQIVASEIRRLADSTVASTSEIKTKISEIQHSSDRLIITSEEGTTKIEEGWQLSKNLQKLFENVLNSSDVSAKAADQIALSIKQQASAFEQILQTLKQISEGIDSFVVSTRSTTDASETLSKMADTLHSIIENFVGGNMTAQEDEELSESEDEELSESEQEE
jgi:methyl-accepting chemotaxis protein